MAIHRFSEFELDEELRQLRWRGDEVALQPRVFDLLAHLVNNRARVVDKDELLGALWPGVVVTDSSVQRAVSLARKALRDGGLDDAIRTVAKRGYRFVAEPQSGSTAQARPALDALAGAHSLFDDGSWREAAEAFARADRESSLAAADLETWGTALQCAGTTPAALQPFERAARAYGGQDDCESAARCVVTLARIRFEMGERSVAKGCLSRAETILEELPLCAAHGHLEWMRSWLASYEGSVKDTIRHARRTVEIGRQLGNVDLEAMGLLFWGIALQASGDTQRGLELQDEAGAAVLTGDVTPLLGGLVYCGLIGGCCNTGDWPRAGQWSDSFTQWCKANGVLRFSGNCIVHRIEVFVARGELERAEQEIRDSDEAIRMCSASVNAEARRFLADLHFLRGEFDEAETAYRAAYEAGCNPHPGYALLLHRRGQSGAAVRALRRSTEGVDWATRERRSLYLAFIAIIAAQSGDLDAAREALTELDSRPDAWAMGTVSADVRRARAELCMAELDPQTAARLFREALDIYQRFDSVLEAAAIRLRLANALLAMEDPEGARLELVSACTALRRAGAGLYLGDCARLECQVSAA